jgi:tetratricopeptide (TPR) repeat protein
VGLYDAEIAFADAQIGRVLRWLHDRTLDSRTLVVVAGDHGEGLGAHGEGTHGFFVYDASVHVPLVVSMPLESLQGVRVGAQVSLVDVAPTIAALAGLEALPHPHGRSLVSSMLAGTARDAALVPGMVTRLAAAARLGHAVEAAAPPEPTYAYSESMTPSLQFGWSALTALRSTRFKFIEAPRPELYDLGADPGETTNVYAQNVDIADGMRRELDRLRKEQDRDAAAPEAANFDAETFQRLASLGYVSGVRHGGPRGGDARDLPDPKDKLAVFTAVQQAGEWMSQDEHQAAATALESALRQEPGMTQARLMLGSCYMELGRARESRSQFDRILKDDPENVQALVGLANVLLDEGHDEDVEALCRRTIGIDERNTQAYGLLGDVYIARHDPARALPFLEKAVEIQPKLTQNRLNLAACQIEVHDLARARATLDAIIDVQPRFPGARFNRGVLYEELGQPDLARQEYEAELAAYPDAFKARFNLGKLQARSHDWTGSTAQMRQVIRVAPRRPEGYLYLARALLHGPASLDEVRSLAEKGLALAKAPEARALGWFLLADVYTRQHRPEDVALALRRARNAQSEADARAGGQARASRKE